MSKVFAVFLPLALLAGMLAGCGGPGGPDQECLREAAATAIARGASVEDVERGDYDDVLREVCYDL